MFSEKINYSRMMLMMMRNLEDLHNSVYQIREEVRDINKMSLMTYYYAKNKFDNEAYKTRKKNKSSKKSSQFESALDAMFENQRELEKIIKDLQKEQRGRVKDFMVEYKERLKTWQNYV